MFDKNAVLNADLCVINDNLSVETIDSIREKGVFDPKKVVIIIDQVIPPNSPDSSAVQRHLMKLGDEQNIEMIYGQTMTAQYLLEKAQAGQVIAAANQTVTAAGVNGAWGICVDEEELKEVLTSGHVTWKAEKSTGIVLNNASTDVCLRSGASALLKTAGDQLKESVAVLDQETFAVYSKEEVLEFVMILSKTGVAGVIVGNASEAENQITVDLADQGSVAVSNMEEETVKKVSDMEPKKVKVVFIGGSAGGNFEQIKTVAEGLRGKKIAYGVRLSVAPATSEIYKEMTRAGYVAVISDAGGLVLNQCADPEIQCRVGLGEVMVSNDWKNPKGYAGYENSEVILTDAETALQAALTGELGTKAVDEEKQAESVVIEGRCWKFGDDIDTDIIIPTQWCCVPLDELKHHVFEPLRPGLTDQMKDGDIIVAGDNFGCGSSREMAAEGIKANGVRCIVAKSFARIFFRNAINNGILLIECPELPDHVTEGDIVRVELNRQIICNGKAYPIGKIAQNLYEIIADGGLVNHVEKMVENGKL